MDGPFEDERREPLAQPRHRGQHAPEPAPGAALNLDRRILIVTNSKFFFRPITLLGIFV